jgi:protein-L-isoaspartate(D-aspartate) O-methyltransferase
MGDVALAALLREQGIRDESVLQAIAALSRRDFVPLESSHQAERNAPLAIGHGQTISQPYIVAYMTELLSPQPGERVLEIGTGSGYQTAVLAQLCREVYSVEIVPELARSARERLDRLGFTQVHTRLADGRQGWREAAPFDAIMLTAAPEHVPLPLLEQLRPGGRLVAPVGPTLEAQQLLLVQTADGGQPRVERRLPVRFVPMTGQARLPPSA